MTGRTPPLDTFTVADHAVCGVLGCHRDHSLRVVYTDRGTQVVCPDHAEPFLNPTAIKDTDSGGVTRKKSDDEYNDRDAGGGST